MEIFAKMNCEVLQFSLRFTISTIMHLVFWRFVLQRVQTDFIFIFHDPDISWLEISQ